MRRGTGEQTGGHDSKSGDLDRPSSGFIDGRRPGTVSATSQAAPGFAPGRGSTDLCHPVCILPRHYRHGRRVCPLNRGAGTAALGRRTGKALAQWHSVFGHAALPRHCRPEPRQPDQLSPYSEAFWGSAAERASVTLEDGKTLQGTALSRSANDMQLLADDHQLYLLRKMESGEYRVVTSQVDWPSYNGQTVGSRYSDWRRSPVPMLHDYSRSGYLPCLTPAACRRLPSLLVESCM